MNDSSKVSNCGWDGTLYLESLHDQGIHAGQRLTSELLVRGPGVLISCKMITKTSVPCQT
jgi:hypothetical protein